MAEHTDLRHIMGVGIAITRGSAAALSFCYSLLLLTMSRNLLTKLKEFSIQQYIPLDAHIQFHKIAACTALFFSVLHTVGHIVNFYHVSTQPIAHLRCLTSEISFPSDARPTISYWLFRTVTGTCFRRKSRSSRCLSKIFESYVHLLSWEWKSHGWSSRTSHCLSKMFESYVYLKVARMIIAAFASIAGVTGIFLFVVMTIIFVFAHPIIRQKAYKFFWSTHSLYVILYALCLIHGLARLTGSPRFWIFFVGPAIIYALDKVMY